MYVFSAIFLVIVTASFANILKSFRCLHKLQPTEKLTTMQLRSREHIIFHYRYAITVCLNFRSLTDVCITLRNHALSVTLPHYVCVNVFVV